MDHPDHKCDCKMGERACPGCQAFADEPCDYKQAMGLGDIRCGRYPHGPRGAWAPCEKCNIPDAYQGFKARAGPALFGLAGCAM